MNHVAWEKGNCVDISTPIFKVKEKLKKQITEIFHDRFMRCLLYRDTLGG